MQKGRHSQHLGLRWRNKGVVRAVPPPLRKYGLIQIAPRADPRHTIPVHSPVTTHRHRRVRFRHLMHLYMLRVNRLGWASPCGVYLKHHEHQPCVYSSLRTLPSPEALRAAESTAPNRCAMMLAAFPGATDLPLASSAAYTCICWLQPSQRWLARLGAVRVIIFNGRECDQRICALHGLK